MNYRAKLIHNTDVFNTYKLNFALYYSESI